MFYQKRLPREDIQEAIEYLVQMYPKAFFLQPHLKRPLKKNIIVDLERNHVLDGDKRTAAVTYYQNDWQYQNCLQAGDKRIDLNGQEAGTVTELEAIQARKRVQTQRQELKEKKLRAEAESPIKVANKLHADGKISTDQLSKIPAPANEVPMAKATKIPQPNGADLTNLRTLWSNIEPVIATVENENLRAALVAPALKVFVTEATKLITTLEGKAS